MKKEYLYLIVGVIVLIIGIYYFKDYQSQTIVDCSYTNFQNYPRDSGYVFWGIQGSEGKVWSEIRDDIRTTIRNFPCEYYDELSRIDRSTSGYPEYENNIYEWELHDLHSYYVGGRVYDLIGTSPKFIKIFICWYGTDFEESLNYFNLMATDHSVDCYNIYNISNQYDTLSTAVQQDDLYFWKLRIENDFDSPCTQPPPTTHKEYSFTPSPNKLLNLEPEESRTISVTLEHLDETVAGNKYDISFDITGIISEEGLKKNYLYQVEK